jgi:hypothetical protein
MSETLAQIAGNPGAFDRATSARAAAHTLVKQLAMGQLAVALDVRQIEVNDGWKNNGSEKPGVLFLVTGDPLQASISAAATDNVVLVRRLGLSFLDELALIRVCDAYIGTCDHSALIAADAGIPCLLESDVDAEYGGRIRCVRDTTAVSNAWIRAIEQLARL